MYDNNRNFAAGWSEIRVTRQRRLACPWTECPWEFLRPDSIFGMAAIGGLTPFAAAMVTRRLG